MDSQIVISPQVQQNAEQNNNNNQAERRELRSQYNNIKNHLYCDMLFILTIRVLQMGFGGFLIGTVAMSHLSSNTYYQQLSIWIAFYILSDFIMLAMVCGSFLFYKQALYRYARFKFIVTSILLVLNFLLLGYGAYIIIKLPLDFDETELASDAKKKKNISIIYIIMRGIVILLISKLQYDMKSHLLPQLQRFSLLPEEVYSQSTEQEIRQLLNQLPHYTQAQITSDPSMNNEHCVICLEFINNNGQNNKIQHGYDVVKMGCGTNQHQFYHFKCLFSWLMEKTMCPLCRATDILSTHNQNPKNDQEQNPNNVLHETDHHDDEVKLRVNEIPQVDLEAANSDRVCKLPSKQDTMINIAANLNDSFLRIMIQPSPTNFKLLQDLQNINKDYFEQRECRFYSSDMTALQNEEHDDQNTNHI
ncbi:zf-rbx1 domain containing protein [Stylonychia lemnae]|uniref:Zf-rbx1 domain containing protein n=1 Tax=Stylonychia lemnae TaxID=5949 RepID=A0A077ZMC1_STYLE|nr:zf-rbx1 domain containing protein [Stylonychia lemnae]|eukprot:CDW71113.1 zf-rbx1 domain containing protein [Stylonychia lemnae]